MQSGQQMHGRCMYVAVRKFIGVRALFGEHTFERINWNRVLLALFSRKMHCWTEVSSEYFCVFSGFFFCLCVRSLNMDLFVLFTEIGSHNSSNAQCAVPVGDVYDPWIPPTATDGVSGKTLQNSMVSGATNALHFFIVPASSARNQKNLFAMIAAEKP